MLGLVVDIHHGSVSVIDQCIN